jgi:hypothetical protein
MPYRKKRKQYTNNIKKIKSYNKSGKKQTLRRTVNKV